MGHLEAGELELTLEYGYGLKDMDWIGKQDPYAVVTCGIAKFRSKTHKSGGKNPVWNQSFTFNLINENNVHLKVMDEDTLGKDDLVGTATVVLAQVRATGFDRQQVPLMSKKGKQRGHVQLSMKFTSNNKASQQAWFAYHGQPSFAPSVQQQPYYAAPPAYGHTQPTRFGAPPPPQPYFHPPPAYGAAPQQPPQVYNAPMSAPPGWPPYANSAPYHHQNPAASPLQQPYYGPPAGIQ